VRNVDVRRTRHGYHVRILVQNRIRKRELNFIQLALGSDYRRECMNLRRIISWKQMKIWNVLFEYKFNNRRDFTSSETFDRRLTKQMALLIKGFRCNRRTKILQKSPRLKNASRISATKLQSSGDLRII
jgi:hypothetical protein